MVAFTCEGRTIAVLYEGTEFEVRVAVDRIDLGYIQPWRAEFIRTRDGTTLFDVDRRLLEPAPSVKVMEALVATFGAGVRAGDRAGRKAGRGEVQAEMRKVLGLDEAAGG